MLVLQKLCLCAFSFMYFSECCSVPMAVTIYFNIRSWFREKSDVQFLLCLKSGEKANLVKISFFVNFVIAFFLGCFLLFVHKFSKYKFGGCGGCALQQCYSLHSTKPLPVRDSQIGCACRGQRSLKLQKNERVQCSAPGQDICFIGKSDQTLSVPQRERRISRTI